MGQSLTKVLFFDETIKIDVHSGTEVEDLRVISIAEFADGQEVRLDSIEADGGNDGDFLVRRADGAFIQGAPQW